MKKDKTTIKTYFETGDKPTQEQYINLIDSYIDARQTEGEPNRRFVIDEKGEVTVTSEQKVPEYTLIEIVGNKLALLKDKTIVKEIDLAPYVDDTNLARLVSGTVDENGLATFTRDDDSTFTVDLSNLKENTPQYQAGNNITIDNSNPEKPIINAAGGSTTNTSNLVPYTGATKDLNLGENLIVAGKKITITDKSKHLYLLNDSNGNNIIKTQIAYWNDTSFVTAIGTGIGLGALENNSSTNSNGFGNNALHNNTGNSSNGFGTSALSNNTGVNANGFGASALSNNTGVNANGFGTSALSNNTGINASGFGLFALSNNNGANASGFGFSTLNFNTGDDSNGFGSAALSGNKGNYSNGYGSYTLQFNKGDNSTAMGHRALEHNEGKNASGFGYNAMQNNKGNTSSGIGHNALLYNIGDFSNGFGHQTLLYNQGSNNNAIGTNAFSNFQSDVANKKIFNSTDIDIFKNIIIITDHNLGEVGEVINLKYQNLSGSKIGNYNNSKIYQFKIIDSNSLESLQNISFKSEGIHELIPQFTFHNSTAIGSHSQPTKSNQIVLGDFNITETTTMGDYVSTGKGKGLVLTTPDGSKQYKINIDNSGNIVTSLI